MGRRTDRRERERKDPGSIRKWGAIFFSIFQKYQREALSSWKSFSGIMLLTITSRSQMSYKRLTENYWYTNIKTKLLTTWGGGEERASIEWCHRKTWRYKGAFSRMRSKSLRKWYKIWEQIINQIRKTQKWRDRTQEKRIKKLSNHFIKKIRARRNMTTNNDF